MFGFISERMQALKQEIQTTFKLNGLQLRLEATKYLADLLIDVAEEEREEWTEKYDFLNLKVVSDQRYWGSKVESIDRYWYVTGALDA